MSFFDVVAAFAEKAKTMKNHVQSEEATKIALIMPFFQQVLGWDVFNPQEFAPEYKANFRSTGTDRVDFAILSGGCPVMLIEAKYVGETLEQHVGQLAGYFAPTDAKFAVLTNGLTYRFYSDVVKSNIMDAVPFLDIDLLALDVRAVGDLEQFAKNRFDVGFAAAFAFGLFHENAIYARLSAEIEHPSDGFIRLLSGSSELPVDTLMPIAKAAVARYISDNAVEITAAPALSEELASEAEQVSESTARAFEIVKEIIESVGSKHRYKIKLSESKKYVTVNYRNCSTINLLKTPDGSFNAARFHGTTIETRKQTVSRDINSVEEIPSLRADIIKQLEFIDWWYLNPKAEAGGVE